MTAIALVVLQILRTLAWAGVHQQPGQFVWRTAAEFEQAWVADRGAKEIRVVNRTLDRAKQLERALGVM